MSGALLISCCGMMPPAGAPRISAAFSDVAEWKVALETDTSTVFHPQGENVYVTLYCTVMAGTLPLGSLEGEYSTGYLGVRKSKGEDGGAISGELDRPVILVQSNGRF